MNDNPIFSVIGALLVGMAVIGAFLLMGAGLHRNAKSDAEWAVAAAEETCQQELSTKNKLYKACVAGEILKWALTNEK